MAGSAVTIAKASLNTCVSLHAVNDLSIGSRSHVSARYTLRLGEREERQSSSGIIVSTGMGSTGWMKSLYAGCTAAALNFGAQVPPSAADAAFLWDAGFLNFFVREPFLSRTTAVTLETGRVSAAAPLSVVSEMPEKGVIFSDGIEGDFLKFNAGTQATIGIAERQVLLVH